MSRFSIALFALLISLGNGLRSIVSSAVFISEAEFSSFLSITVEATAVVSELLMGAVLIALLLAPWLMNQASNAGIALLFTIIAAIAALLLSALFYLSPKLDVRIIAVTLLFPTLGFALATLTPLTQSWTRIDGKKQEKILLAVWLLATPIAFLTTPQLVREIVPRLGLEKFFALFALLMTILGVIIWFKRRVLNTLELSSKVSVQGTMFWYVLGAVVAFQMLTTITSLQGITSTLGPGLVILLFIFFVCILRKIRARIINQSEKVIPNNILYLLLSLALLNMATTGFFDTSFLVEHSCSNTLIADRATLSALSQISATLLTSALVAKYMMHKELVQAGVAFTTAGLSLYLLYPGVIGIGLAPISDDTLYILSRVLTGFGSAMATTAIIFLVTRLESNGGTYAFMLSFVIILGTESGLELLQIASDVWQLKYNDPSAPYALIFCGQIVLSAASLISIIRVKFDRAF